MTGAADRLRAAARTTGVLEGDPLAVLVEVLADAVLQIARGQEALASSNEDLPGRVFAVLTAGREAASAEAERFRAELAASEADVVRRVGRAIAEAADAGLVRRGRALDRRTGLLAAFVLVAGIAGAGSVGWWTGRESGRREVVEVAADMRGLFQDGIDTADAWRNLVAWNDLRSALRTCGDPGGITVQDGRRTCRVPLWLSRPTAPPHEP